MKHEIQGRGVIRTEAEADGADLKVAELRLDGLAVNVEQGDAGEPALVRLQAGLAELGVGLVPGIAVAAAKRIAERDVRLERQAAEPVGTTYVERVSFEPVRILVLAAHRRELAPVAQALRRRALQPYPGKHRAPLALGAVVAGDPIDPEAVVFDPAIISIQHVGVDPVLALLDMRGEVEIRP